MPFQGCHLLIVNLFTLSLLTLQSLTLSLFTLLSFTLLSFTLSLFTLSLLTLLHALQGCHLWRHQSTVYLSLSPTLASQLLSLSLLSSPIQSPTPLHPNLISRILVGPILPASRDHPHHTSPALTVLKNVTQLTSVASGRRVFEMDFRQGATCRWERGGAIPSLQGPRTPPAPSSQILQASTFFTMLGSSSEPVFTKSNVTLVSSNGESVFSCHPNPAQIFIFSGNSKELVTFFGRLFISPIQMKIVSQDQMPTDISFSRCQQLCQRRKPVNCVAAAKPHHTDVKDDKLR